MKKIIIIIFFIIFTTTVCGKKKEYVKADKILKKMSLDHKIGQLIMPAIPGKELNNKVIKIIKDFYPGGIILFGFNLSDGDGIKKYLKELDLISMKNSNIPLFVSIDQEGGRVKRFVKEVTQFPGNMAAGVSNDKKLVYNWGRILGIQLRQLGVNMNLAPDIDVNNNPGNPVINIRSFGSNEKLVSRMGVSYIKGLQDSKCIAIAKHFPGHGDTDKDSHLTLPVINYDMNRLRKIELVPFKKAIEMGVDGIMSAHIAFPKILKNNDTATISKYFLTDILRKELKFDGLIMTDALEMNAISNKFSLGEAAVKSIKAGADIVLLTSYDYKKLKNAFYTIKKAVESGDISVKRLNSSVRKIIERKLRYKILSYKKGKHSISKNYYTEKEIKFLSKADNVNKELSKKGIFYYGNIKFIHPDKKVSRLFISRNKLFRNNIILDGNDFLINNISDIKIKKRSKGAEKILYYHLNSKIVNIRYLKNIYRICKKNKIKLVWVASNNPFPITRSGVVDSILTSFSNTRESIRQLTGCLNGKFKPNTKSKLNLGIK
jgi:beta-N-acetylhexosaminidase